MTEQLPQSNPGHNFVADIGLPTNAETPATESGLSTLATVANAMSAPLRRLAHRPWLNFLSDVDQEDSFEYHNPTLALIGRQGEGAA